MLNAENITVRYGEKTVLDQVSFSVDSGEWWMVAGPNGAGKSTLLSAVTRGVPCAGRITLLGRDVSSYRPEELARQVGMLEQNHAAGYAFTVEEVVTLGRYAHRTGFLRRGDAEGEDKVRQALALTGLQELARRSVLTLSGGEMQRVFLAQVLAQDPRLLLLDEPANHLDLIYQKQLFSLIGDWLKTPGRAVISVVHDLALARRYGTHALLLRQGKTVSDGRTAEVFTPQNLQTAYGMDVFAWMQGLYAAWQQ